VTADPPDGTYYSGLSVAPPPREPGRGGHGLPAVPSRDLPRGLPGVPRGLPGVPRGLPNTPSRGLPSVPSRDLPSVPRGLPSNPSRGLSSAPPRGGHGLPVTPPRREHSGGHGLPVAPPRREHSGGHGLPVAAPSRGRAATLDPLLTHGGGRAYGVLPRLTTAPPAEPEANPPAHAPEAVPEAPKAPEPVPATPHTPAEPLTEPVPATPHTPAEPLTEPVHTPAEPLIEPVTEPPAEPLAETDVDGDALAAEIDTELAAQAGTTEPEPRKSRSDPHEWHGIVLVTGTDTEVGKTISTAAMAAAAQQAGLRVAVIKPGQTGTATGAPTDAEVINRLAGPETMRTLAEYPEPLAPLAAAKVAGMPALDLFDVVDAIRAEADKHDLVLVEGAGGLLVPMGLRPSGEAWTFADLATTLGANVIVVSRAGLGTLNHTALTLEALHRRGVYAKVILGAWPAEPELVHWANLGELVPHLVGALPSGAGSMDPGVFRRSATGWLTPALHGVLDNWRVWAEEAG
jgi:dethiobiotin synthetase